MTLPADLAACIEKDNRPFAALRSLGSTARYQLYLIVVLVVTGAVGLATSRADFATYPIFRMVLALGTFLLVLLMAARVLLRPYHKAPIRRLWSRLLIVTGIATPIIFAGLPDAYRVIDRVAPTAAELMPKAWQCLLFGSMTAIPLVLIGWLLDRSAYRTGSRTILAGLAAVMCGNLALQIHCPNPDPMHLLLGHAGVLGPIVLAVWMIMLRKG